MKTKRIIVGLWFVVLGVGIFSCSRDMGLENEKLNNQELLPVSFSVGFTKDVTEFRSSEASSLDGYDLNYLVYNSETGALYKELRLNFSGVINDSLPEGNYTIIFAAVNRGTGGSYGIRSADPIKNSVFSFPYIELPRRGPSISYNENIDVLYKKMNFIVAKKEQNNGSVSLDRIVGKIKVVIEDVIPDEVVAISVSVDYVPDKFYYSYDSDYSEGSRPGFYSPFGVLGADKIANGITFYYIAFENIDQYQSRYPGSITLTALRSLPAGVVDTGQSIVATKTINNVDVLKNKTVVYTGKLFDNVTPPPGTNPSSSFSISLNDEWGETINKQF